MLHTSASLWSSCASEGKDRPTELNHQPELFRATCQAEVSGLALGARFGGLRTSMRYRLWPAPHETGEPIRCGRVIGDIDNQAERLVAGSMQRIGDASLHLDRSPGHAPG